MKRVVYGHARRKAGFRLRLAKGLELGRVYAGCGFGADSVYGPLDHAAGGLGSDAELLAYFPVGLLAAVVEAKALFHGEASPAIEHIEQPGDHAVFFVGQGQVFWAGVVVGKEIDQFRAVVIANHPV